MAFSFMKEYLQELRFKMIIIFYNLYKFTGTIILYRMRLDIQFLLAKLQENGLHFNIYVTK